ncbi:hypothetical protein E1A91_A04G183300v1 [Gossypium mustelinum]|uniref:Protein kinase domain-containing protein n=1 Tax=Gossypium mustelinum TaxID=34275 RepID=A0A5D2ZSE7_GOSMU|nr:hypothetical protein E1A91_A04G183300v1 [Gossypium mustelinum]
MKKPMSALVFLLLFSFINGTESRKDPPPICSSSCRDSLEIRYPFRLPNDPFTCGDPDFELRCENNKTIMNFHGGLYYVKGISYDNHTIQLVDVNFSDDGKCSLPNRSLSTSEILMDDRYPGLVNFTNSYTLNYVRCSDSSVGSVNNSIVPCLTRNSSHVYVNVTNWSSLTSYDVPKTCKVIAMAPAFYEESVPVNPSYETVLKMQQSGFQMVWSVECRDCRAKGRGCVYKSADTSFLFECEKEYDYNAELRYIYTVVAAMFLAAIIGFIRFILLPLVVFSFILHKYLSTKKDYREKSSEIQQPLAPERYNYTDILSMSNNFKDKIGEGCFGTVYKGQLHDDYSIVVKKLESFKVSEEHFINGVSRTSGIQHPNLVPILGFCSEGSKHVLVNQYMPNGSLDKYVGNSDSFSWEKVREIVLKTGQGIEFLHGGSGGGIIHLDIKPRNILLDENFRPRISDFGIAKLCRKKHDLVSLYGRSETMGYMAPELMVSRDFEAVSCKSDVYSFGMIILEMACGRRHVDVDAINSSKVHFPTWVYELNERGDLEFENLTKSDTMIARKLFIIGLWCTQTRPLDRPSMTRVLEMLETDLDDLEMPPKPVFISAQNLREPELDSPKEMLLPETMERSS